MLQKRFSFGLVLTVILTAFFYSCAKKDVAEPTDKLLKSDGKTPYKTVTIGGKVWMAENYEAITDSNGKPIPLAKDIASWKNFTDQKLPARCYYNNDSGTYLKYGPLYNGYALEKLAPKGWHVPTKDEFKGLVAAIKNGRNNILAQEISNMLRIARKEPAAGENPLLYWGGNTDTDTDKTDSSGFAAFPAGWLNTTPEFAGSTLGTRFWTITPDTNSSDLYFFSMVNNTTEFGSQKYGYSVRLVKN